MTLMLGVGVLGVASGVMYLKSQQPAKWDSLASSFFDVEVPDLKRLARSTSRADRDLAKNLERDYDAVFAKVLERNPELIPKWKTVPDEKNGFLQWLDFCEKYRRGRSLDFANLKLPESLARILDGQEDWDTQTVKKYLADQKDLIDEVTRIGLLGEQSTSGIPADRWSFQVANFSKRCADLLCAAARVAAEEGNAEKSMLRARAALGLAKHHSQVETPTIIAETVAILIQLTVLDTSMKHIIPKLKPDREGVAQWRELLKPVSSEDFSQVIRGEFWGSVRGMLIPMMLNNANHVEEVEVRDPEALYDAIAQAYSEEMNQVQLGKLADLWQNKSDRLIPETPGSISPEAKEVYDLMFIGWGVYGSGWARAHARYRHYDAALAILEGSEPPLELLTEKPFVFDQASRTLAFPSDPILEGIDAKPILIP